MPPKSLKTNQTSHSPQKRNLVDMRDNHENKVQNVRKNKKRKHDGPQCDNKEENEAASSEAVASFRSIRTAFSANSINVIKCAICLNTAEYSDFTHMLCKRSFHTVCLETWFQVQKTCPVCMTDKCIDNNPLEIAVVENNRQVSEEVQCVICMDMEESTDFLSMPCGHKFHEICLQTWWEHKTICPICLPHIYVNNTENVIEDGIICDVTDEARKEIKCVICLDTVECKEFEFISCCHSFHMSCIRKWYSVRKMCPICMVNSASNMHEVVPEFREQVGCIICMDAEVSSDFQNLICEHSFHTLCLQTWLQFQINKACPICMPSNSPVHEPVEDKIEVQCVICMDTAEASDFQNLLCCHRFHSVCIQNWLRVDKSCPVCRTSASENEMLPASIFTVTGAVYPELRLRYIFGDDYTTNSFNQIFGDSFEDTASISTNEETNDLIEDINDVLDEDSNDTLNAEANNTYDEGTDNALNEDSINSINEEANDIYHQVTDNTLNEDSNNSINEVANDIYHQVTDNALNEDSNNSINEVANDIYHHVTDNALNEDSNNSINEVANDIYHQVTDNSLNEDSNNSINEVANDIYHYVTDNALNEEANESVNEDSNDSFNEEPNYSFNEESNDSMNDHTYDELELEYDDVNESNEEDMNSFHEQNSDTFSDLDTCTYTDDDFSRDN